MQKASQEWEQGRGGELDAGAVSSEEGRAWQAMGTRKGRSWSPACDEGDRMPGLQELWVPR